MNPIWWVIIASLIFILFMGWVVLSARKDSKELGKAKKMNLKKLYRI